MSDGTSRRHEPYTLFAHCYDAGWSDYSRYVAELVLSLARESGRRFETVCDAACGTGLLLELLDDGRRFLAGFDRSRAMLERAMARVPHADLRPGELGAPPRFARPFDLICCVYDSLNYLLDEQHLRAFFVWARDSLASGGVLLVDLNSHAIYDPEVAITRNHLIHGRAFREVQRFSPGEEPRVITRFSFPEGEEEHVQRPWESEEVERLASLVGVELLDTLDVMDEALQLPSGKVVYLFVERSAFGD